MKVVIFAGGVGSRLWPLSREKSPKQFEKIIGNKSTLQLAVARLRPDFAYKDIYIATDKRYIDLVTEQLPHIPPENIFGEPERRDVGAAVVVAIGLLAKENPLEPVAILWSDHLVQDEVKFRKILLESGRLLKEDPNKMIFISHKPRFASENLGWIYTGDEIKEESGIVFREFKKFKYRPNKAIAEEWFADPRYSWNLGYFATTPQFVMEKTKEFEPEIYELAQKIINAPNRQKALAEFYPQMPKMHFDNIIPERIKPKDAMVVVEDIGWADIGAWEALKEALSDTIDENVTKGNVTAQDSKDTLIFNYEDKLVVGIDLNELLVINTQDVLLVCPKNSVPKIKKFVETLKGTKLEKLA
jgi:mannose-1-phosphate guanylyltransferase